MSKSHSKVLYSKKLSNMSSKVSRIVGWGSISILGLLLFTLLSPVQASEIIALEAGQSEARAGMDTTVYVQSAISLALPSRLDMEIVPRATGTISTATARLSVATNNSSGYGIYLGTVSGEQTLTQAGGDGVITPLTTATTIDNWTEQNTWGYQLTQTGTTPSTEEHQYKAVPGNTMQVKNINTVNPAEDRDNFDLNFGVAVSATLPAGAYTNQVLVSVVANPRTIQNLEEAIYLQDFDGTRNANGTTATSSKICEQSTVGMTRQLIDQRDGKKYWVAKLADNNCWMVQNLALDLSTSKPLTPADSDVASSWTPSSDTETTLPEGEKNTPQTAQRSWNLGEYVIITPQQDALLCDVDPGQTLSACTVYQQVDDSWTYVPAIIGTWGDYNGLVAADATNKTYDSHYLVGNYYQYNTATAGSGGEIIDIEAASSICPMGWKLPTSGRNTTTGIPLNKDNSFAKLLAAYGYPEPGQANGWSNLDVETPNGRISTTYAGATRLDGTPMYYVRNGRVMPGTGGLSRADGNGYIWSSTAGQVATSAYYMVFDYLDEIYPANNNNRYNGYSVRCLAR